MVKLQRRGGNGVAFLTAEIVTDAIKSAGKADFQIKRNTDPEIEGHGVVFEVEDNFNEGQTKPAVMGTLRMSKKKDDIKDVRWTMNNTSYNYLIEKLGDDDNDWENKFIELEVLPTMVNGKRVQMILPVGAGVPQQR